MFITSLALSILLAMSVPTLLTAADDAAPVTKIFVPSGYDDNDDVQIMLQGSLPNECFKITDVAVDRISNSKQVRVQTKVSYIGTGVFCTQSISTFLEAVKVGQFEQGIYEIIVNPGENELRTTIAIGKSRSSSRDDFLYAPVEYADIIVDDEGQDYLYLEGQFPLYKRGCARLVNVRQLRDAEDLLTILPIMKVYDDEHCGNADQTFKEKIPLDMPFASEGLLHVRTQDGESLNKLVSK